MILNYVRQTLTFIAFLSIVVAGCNASEGRPPPDVIIDLTGDAGVAACTQPFFPDEQPDISPFTPPEFVTETGEEQRLVQVKSFWRKLRSAARPVGCLSRSATPGRRW